MAAATDAVNPFPCSPACETAARRLADEVLPMVLADGPDRPPGIDAADSELNLSRFSTQGRRWHVAGLVAAVGERTPQEMATRIEAKAGAGGDLERAAAGCRSFAQALNGGGGASGLILKGASEACCVFAFGGEAAGYWTMVAKELSHRALMKRITPRDPTRFKL